MGALKAMPQPQRVPPHRQPEGPFTTFATMLQSNLRRLEELQIKLPPWLYLATPYERKDQCKLSPRSGRTAFSRTARQTRGRFRSGM